LLWLAMPILGTLGISALTDMTYNVRYASPAFPAFVMLLASGLGCLRWQTSRLLLLNSVFLVFGASLYNYYFDPRYAREDVRSAAAYMKSVAQSRDSILVVGSRVSWEHYNADGLQFRTIPRRILLDDHADIHEHMQTVIGGSRFVWLVLVRYWEVDPNGRVKSFLDSEFSLVTHKQFAGVDILRYRIHLVPSRSEQVPSPPFWLGAERTGNMQLVVLDSAKTTGTSQSTSERQVAYSAVE
jgi:hypothetical protein